MYELNLEDGWLNLADGSEIGTGASCDFHADKVGDVMAKEPQFLFFETAV